MNRQKSFILLTAAAAMVAGACSLVYFRSAQRLGKPGIRTTSIPGELNVKIPLPEDVPGYRAESQPPDKVTVATLPKDTSLAQSVYETDDRFQIALNVVLMGMDRTSIHKPQFCLVGSGWRIDKSEEVTVPMSRPVPYDLPVMKLSVSRDALIHGQTVRQQGIYLYWFVTDGELTARHSERIWSMARSLLATGVLERWAYVSCMAICAPGNEDLTFDRMKHFIMEAVPQFQLVPASPGARADALRSR